MSILSVSALVLACAWTGVHPVAAAPTTMAVVTDQAKITVGDKFNLPPTSSRLTDGGSVLFTAQGSSGLFEWNGASPTRLLQVNDPMPGYPGGLVSGIGLSQVNSAGHAAIVLFWVRNGENSPTGVFVYDGSFQEVATTGDPAPGTGKNFAGFGGVFINPADQVAFTGFYGPSALGMHGVFLGEPGGPTTKIALTGETAPGTGGGAYSNVGIRGLTGDGEVVFFANIEHPLGGFQAFFRWNSIDGVSLIAKAGDSAPGTIGTFSDGLGPSFVNADGDLAFIASVTGAGPTNRGIWVWDSGTGDIDPLVLNTDATPLGGAFGGNLALRDFNDNGKVLFSSNVAGLGAINNALFVKEVAVAADVVFYRTQSAPGGTTEEFFQTQQAALNNSDAVVFLAQLQAGPASNGWFVWTGPGAPSKIVLEGDSLLGGAAGLAGRLGAPFALRLNGGNDVALTADVRGPNITAMLLWDGSSLTPVVKSSDSLPSGANLIIRTPNGPRSSEDEVLFAAFRAGGTFTYFTARLKGAAKIRRIAGEGDLTPGGAGTIVDLGNARINNNGTVTVNASILGTGVYPGSAVYISKPGAALQKLVASGDATPAGGTYTNVGLHRLNNNGQVAFLANVTGGTGSLGIFIDSLVDPAEIVVVQNDEWEPGVFFQSVNPTGGHFELNDGGLVVFDARVGPPSSLYGLFAWDAGVIENIVLQGDEITPGVFFDQQASVLSLNNNGQLAWASILADGGDSLLLWGGPGSGLPQILARTGTAAPGAIGATFNGFAGGTIAINNSGKVAFGAMLTDGISNPTAGYFLYDGANVLARLREGDPLPGGGFAGPVLAALALSEQGEVAMAVPDVTGDDPNYHRFVIANAAGTLRELATAGDNPPGSGNSRYGRLFTPITTSPAGQFLFTAALVGDKARSGVFASSAP